ncbi:hypothetical protein TrVFT333_007883 [Trichoderma virens FT-333]|nr:hypothetical protein TrVFT333_007883 [Trichoderma virens FT-333]
MAIPLSSYSLGLPALSPPHIVPTACLSAAIVFLIVFYDVLYACQDIEDDLKSGVKGMAVYFRNYIEPLLITVTGLITGCLAMMGKLIDMGQLFFMFSVIGVSMSLLFLVAIVHWKILPSWSSYSAWFYALAIVNLAGGFTLEYFTRVVEGL